MYLILNLTMLHDFFFRFPSAKFKKKKKIIGRDVNNHMDLERAKKDY